ncbi:hypothetical protein K435DRAFT_714094 [Dendrothele bispora CBS 962.96]|uniref:Inner centromere protein ARK-binding domain-containing protein n=1 Tax=Dendrothele bispora (strain CBS 962.96) TaxID=1314807 RepID=A0A4S8MPN7_DENBC|nr:hypothetical protein K435DRAFT_714094 [Dendrothele bispora CBS 962.96]
MAQALNLEWANSIRFNMVNDPGRQSFKEQIDMYGYRFLDDYLDNILSKPKQDSGLIDLVKTPSRKKAVSHKAKANPSPSKLRNMITLDGGSSKENELPLNSFQKALLKVKDEEQSSLPFTFPFQSANRQSHYEAILVDPAPVQSSTPVLVEPVNETSATQDNGNPIELSMIMEDDESAEKSRRSIHITSDTNAKSVPDAQEHQSISEPELMDITTSSSADTFYSIPLASPHTNPSTPPSKSPVRDTHPAVVTTTVPEPPPAESESQDVPEVPLPSHDEEMKVSEEAAEEPSYPTLPAPLPLRKSMRAPRDPSMGVALSNPTPGPPLGKRTSWLAKARQVNASEHKPSDGPSGAGRQMSIAGGEYTGSFGVPTSKRKSEDFFGPMAPGAMRQDETERHSKAMKERDIDVAPLKAPKDTPPPERDDTKENDEASQDKIEHVQEDQQLGMLDHFKKTVEGLGARFGKSMGKSSGQAVASALAEARAAAEARVVERNNDEITKTHGPVVAAGRGPTPPPRTDVELSKAVSPKALQQGRLSLSDLAPPQDKSKAPQEVDRVFQLVPPGAKANSPEPKKDVPAFTRPLGNLFDKAAPVFVAPPKPKVGPKVAPKATSPPPTSVFSKPVTMSVGLSPRLGSPKHGGLLTAHSTTESIQSTGSEQLFGSQEPPSWMTSTQDTEYDDSQPQKPLEQLDDDDDSWPMDEKLPEGMQWPVSMNFSEGDSMTWSSSNPTQTHRLDTEDLGRAGQSEPPEERDPPSTVPGSFHMDVDDDDDEEVEEIIDLAASKSTVSLVDPSKIPRSETAMSMSSTSSTQSSNIGFFGQATKLVSSVLGSGKKVKPEVKSLQLAAAAAKKEQEEKEKKAAVMKNMENRRQQALQRKAEEEKTRKVEEERKIKEEAERRKREREDQTDKRPLKLNSSLRKDEEPANKTRKLELKKPVTKVPLSSSTKTTFKPALKQSSSTINHPPIAGSSSKVPNPAPAPQKAKGKAPVKGVNLDDDVSQPSHLLQNQMAARARAQLEAAQQSEPPIPSESIELPDVNSEYSDSDDEDRVKTFDPPDWAQSPELHQALQNQSSINPDDIFGAVRPLRMEEIFRTRTSRFRARTSSANWSGSDRLTVEEEREYARRMGFR